MKTPDHPSALTGPSERSDVSPVACPSASSGRRTVALDREPPVRKRFQAERNESRSWIEQLRTCPARPTPQIAPEVARRLSRAGVPDAIIAQLPANFETDPWVAKLVTLPGVAYDGHEYVPTKLIFIALCERAGANKAVRVARVMRFLGWERCKLYPHLGFGRKVVRGFKRPLDRGGS